MLILITGGTGFIGRHLVAELLAAGHEVRLAARDSARASRLFPGAEVVPCDMNRDVSPADWLPRLAGVAAVVNCAGVLQGGRGRDIDAIHRRAPVALFEACVQAGVPRVVQVSALGAGPASGTAYGASKQAADEALLALPLEGVVVQPSLAYLPSGSYGGTSLFRALASCPFLLPVPGAGQQRFQPIAMADLTLALRRLIEAPQLVARRVAAVGPEAVTLLDLLQRWRRWLGFAPARVLHLPDGLVRLAGRVGDLFGDGPITTTALRMMRQDNVAAVAGFVEATGVEPRAMDPVFAAAPAHAQDRWHARLYLVRPLLRLLLALVWIATGLATLLQREAGAATLTSLGWPPDWSLPAAWAGGLWDLLLGGLLLAGWRRRAVLAAMGMTLLLYALALAILLPATWTSWLLPASLLLPFAALTAVQRLLENDR